MQLGVLREWKLLTLRKPWALCWVSFVVHKVTWPGKPGLGPGRDENSSPAFADIELRKSIFAMGSYKAAGLTTVNLMWPITTKHAISVSQHRAVAPIALHAWVTAFTPSFADMQLFLFAQTKETRIYCPKSVSPYGPSANHRKNSWKDGDCKIVVSVRRIQVDTRNQFGFRPFCSAPGAVLNSVEETQQPWLSRSIVTAVSSDSERAYNNVPRNLSDNELQKLNCTVDLLKMVAHSINRRTLQNWWLLSQQYVSCTQKFTTGFPLSPFFCGLLILTLSQT